MRTVRSSFGSSDQIYLIMAVRITGKMAKAAAPKPNPAKTKREWNQSSVADFRKLYLENVNKEACLPYAASGGRRPDLAVSCKAWVRKAVGIKGIKTF